QLTCTPVRLADFRQGVFTEALRIALASFCKFEDLFRDQFIGGIASALDVKSRTSHFESEPNDSQALGVKPLAVQVLSDWHGRALLAHRRERDWSLSHGRLAQCRSP